MQPVAKVPRSIFWSIWIWLVMGCGVADSEPEMAGDSVLGMSSAPGSTAGRPGSEGSRPAAAETSAAVSGGAAQAAMVGASEAGAAAASSGAAGAGASVAGSAGVAGTSSGGASNAGVAGTNSGGSSATQAGSAAAGSGTGTTSNAPLTVYIASDSTASSYKDTGSDKDQAGWGQMLPELVKPNVKVDNRAIGGRTARRFIDEGTLDKIWNDIQAGDYLLVQFGTNDGNKTATYELNGQQIPYYLDPETDFKTWIKKYIQGAREHAAVPVLVTPPPRNSAYCTGGNGTGAHAQALRELGESEQVLVVDLNQKTVDYLKAICPEPSPPDFFLQKPDGTVDGTHFQKSGARKLASFVAEGLREQLVGFIKD